MILNNKDFQHLYIYYTTNDDKNNGVIVFSKEKNMIISDYQHLYTKDKIYTCIIENCGHNNRTFLKEENLVILSEFILQTKKIIEDNEIIEVEEHNEEVEKCFTGFIKDIKEIYKEYHDKIDIEKYFANISYNEDLYDDSIIKTYVQKVFHLGKYLKDISSFKK